MIFTEFLQYMIEGGVCVCKYIMISDFNEHSSSLGSPQKQNWTESPGNKIFVIVGLESVSQLVLSLLYLWEAAWALVKERESGDI